MLRKLKRRLNRLLSRAGFAPLFLLAACSQCNLPPPPPEEPTSTTGTSTTGATPSIGARCKDACDFYRANECVEASDVCAADGFDESGECVKTFSCEDACAESPDFYLAKECEP
jgi:hypothetical protein